MPDEAPPPRPIDPHIVIETIRLFFLQFVLVVGGLGWAMLHTNWNLNPSLNGMAYMLMTAEIGFLGLIGNFALGSSLGSAMKNMMMYRSPSVTIPTDTGSTVKAEVKPTE